MPEYLNPDNKLDFTMCYSIDEVIDALADIQRGDKPKDFFKGSAFRGWGFDPSDPAQDVRLLDFRGLDLSHTYWEQVLISRAGVFDSANLQQAVFSACTIGGSFKNAVMHRITIRDASDFSWSSFHGADLSMSNMQGEFDFTDWTGAQIADLSLDTHSAFMKGLVTITLPYGKPVYATKRDGAIWVVYGGQYLTLDDFEALRHLPCVQGMGGVR